MRRRLATLAVITLCAVAARSAAQEPADAPSPRLMEVYAVQPGAAGASGSAEARRGAEASSGIGRLAPVEGQPPEIGDYLRAVR